LDDAGRERYSRQLLIPEWGEAGQARLGNSTVLVAGLGGLGGPVCLYLAAAGVGKLILCDSGTVELSNLNRQILYSVNDLDHLKAPAAAARLKNLNPLVTTLTNTDRIDASNAAELASGADIIVDCLDNFPTRLLLNTQAVGLGIPFVHGGIYGTGGQFAFLHPPHTPCLACLFGDHESEPVRTGKSSSAAPLPVVGAIAGIIACMEALAALRFLVLGEPTLPNRLWRTDGWDSDAETLAVSRDPRCPVCGNP
jgi:adenylyltransferase/sulfurtransferase